MFGLQKLSPWPIPTISKREVTRCVGRSGAWYMKRARNILYEEYEDDLYTAVPAISITWPVSGPLAIAMCDVDTKATSANTEFSVDAEVIKPPQVTGTVPAPGADYENTAFNTVRETNEMTLDSECNPTSLVTNGEAAKSSPAPTCDKCKSTHLKDQVLISKDPFIPPVSLSPGPRHANTLHQQSLGQLTFDKLRRSKRADSSNALPDGHSRTISDSSDASTLVNFPGGGSRTHSLTALDLASSTHRIEDSCQKPIVATPELEDAAQDSMNLNSDPANANGVENQIQISLDMAYRKIEAYKVAVISLRNDNETLTKENDTTLQRAAGVAQGLRYELDCLKERDAQPLGKNIDSIDAEKVALRAENTRLCGTINDICLQLGVLQSSHHSLEADYESEKREHNQLSASFLRLVQGRIEQQEESKALEKEIETMRHDLGEFAGDSFERMVRLTLALNDRGIDAMDEEYRKICERAPYYVGFDETDITNISKEEDEHEGYGNNQAAGGEAEAENRSNDAVYDEEGIDKILDASNNMEAPKSEAGQESPETYNARRRREIAEAEERLLGPIGIAISAAGTVKKVKATRGLLHPNLFRQTLNSGLDGDTIDGNMASKTGKDKGIPGKDWQIGASEIRSLFQCPKPAKIELLDLPAPGTLVEGQLATNDDFKKVPPRLNEMVTQLNHEFGAADRNSESILIPANTGHEGSGHANEDSHVPSIKSTGGIEAHTIDVMTPNKDMEKSSPSVRSYNRGEVVALPQDHASPSFKVAAATDVDNELPHTLEDEAWLDDVLANIAMVQNDHLQSSDESAAYQVESEAEEDLAASSDLEGEDLEDNQDQVFENDDGNDGDDHNESAMGYAVSTSSDAMGLKEPFQSFGREQDLVTTNVTEFQSSNLKIAALFNGGDSSFTVSKIKTPPAVSSALNNDGGGEAFSTLDCGNHIKKSSSLAQETVPDTGSTRFSSAINFGGRAILPAFASSNPMSLAEAAAAPVNQNPRDFDFLNAVSSSAKTNAELGQIERGLGNKDIPQFDHKARAKDLKEYTTIVDKAKIEAGSSTNPSEIEVRTDRNRGQTPIEASTQSKAFSLPHSESFVFVSKSTCIPSMHAQTSLFPAVTSENNANSHAGFSFSPGFVANARAQSASMEMQIYSPINNLNDFTSNPALTQQRIPSPAEAAVLPSVPHSSGAAVFDTLLKIAPSKIKVTDQARPAKPKASTPQPKTSTTETTKAKVKATKPKVSVAAAIALEKTVKEQREAAEEKQRELANRQRKAAARRRTDAGGNGGRP